MRHGKVPWIRYAFPKMTAQEVVEKSHVVFNKEQLKLSLAS